ncbi:hypothetical protein [Polaribacter sp.]|uniref:hypothetical protein n=1 Tax=Polaribacter sp. TaxID=1920175 RepID=UPI003F6CA9C3
MNLKSINNKLNKNVNEETEYLNSIPLWKYFLVYIPVLFLMFAVAQFIGSLLFDINFKWIAIFIQAVLFAVFFRIFHYIKKRVKENWNNKYN